MFQLLASVIVGVKKKNKKKSKCSQLGEKYQEEKDEKYWSLPCRPGHLALYK